MWWNVFGTCSGMTSSKTSTIWAHLDHPNLGRIGALVVYAPNSKKDRAKLWHDLSKQEQIFYKAVVINAWGFQNLSDLHPLKECVCYDLHLKEDDNHTLGDCEKL